MQTFFRPSNFPLQDSDLIHLGTVFSHDTLLLFHWQERNSDVLQVIGCNGLNRNTVGDAFQNCTSSFTFEESSQIIRICLFFINLNDVQISAGKDLLSFFDGCDSDLMRNSNFGENQIIVIQINCTYIVAPSFETSIFAPFKRGPLRFFALTVSLLCTCQQKLDTKLKKLGIKIEYLYKIQ